MRWKYKEPVHQFLGELSWNTDLTWEQLIHVVPEATELRDSWPYDPSHVQTYAGYSVAPCAARGNWDAL